MPNNPPGGLGHVPVAVYSCATTSTTLDESEERGRYYADARHWHVAGVWSDPDPAQPLRERPGWQAVTVALSAGMIRGVVVSSTAHVASGAVQFAALGVLLRDRGRVPRGRVERHPGPSYPRPGPAPSRPCGCGLQMVRAERHAR
ncbi:hypothetical protein ACGF8B_07620 [Streptomyces sp. NPDC047917]|uniref:hypothetical protein n=1 Tax=Streptomyces sp. NPDC047917 TaxID=3365491 RepID=UPI00371FA7B3